MKKTGIALKVFLLIVANDTLDSLAQIVIKKGLIESATGPIALNNITEFVCRNASSLLIWVGVFIYIVNFLLWITVLFKVDLSIAMPVGSFSYMLTPLAAIIFLHERVSVIRWLGIFCIMAGIHFVSQSKHSLRGAP